MSSWIERDGYPEFVPYQGDEFLMSVPVSKGWISDTQHAIYQAEVGASVQMRNALDQERAPVMFRYLKAVPESKSPKRPRYSLKDHPNGVEW